jgi:hypothetical protein
VLTENNCIGKMPKLRPEDKPAFTKGQHGKETIFGIEYNYSKIQVN